jgi:predicted nucleic acid-binding protein
MQLAADLEVPGARVFDLAIAVVVMEAGAREIWTYDKAFVRVPGLRTVHAPS